MLRWSSRYTPPATRTATVRLRIIGDRPPSATCPSRQVRGADTDSAPTDDLFSASGVQRPGQLALDRLVGPLTSSLARRGGPGGGADPQQVHRDHDQAQHREVHAQVEDHRGGHVVTQQVSVQRLEEAALQEPEGAGAESHRDAPSDEEQGEPERADLSIRRRGQIHQRDDRGPDERGDESAAGLVVPAHEEHVERSARIGAVTRTMSCSAAEFPQAQLIARSAEVPWPRSAGPCRRRAVPPVSVGIDEHVTNAGEHGDDRDAGHAEHGQLAERVQGSELHQDDVDDVVPTGDLLGVAM